LLGLAGGDVEAVRGEHVTAAANEGDPASLAIIEDFAGWVALGLANLVAILDVERCVIGGGLVDAGDALLSPLRAALPPVVLAAQHRRPVPLAPAELGERAGAIGAALLARHLPGASRDLNPRDQR
jgi:glucokinase